MTEPEHMPVPITDAPNPSVAEVEQRDISWTPAVPVTIENTAPIRTLSAPNRVGAISVDSVDNTTRVRLLSNDPKRAIATIVCAADMNISRGKSGALAFWPAKVPLVVTHADEVWAQSTSGSVIAVTTVTETYAD